MVYEVGLYLTKCTPPHEYGPQMTILEDRRTPRRMNLIVGHKPNEKGADPWVLFDLAGQLRGRRRVQHKNLCHWNVKV